MQLKFFIEESIMLCLNKSMEIKTCFKETSLIGRSQHCPSLLHRESKSTRSLHVKEREVECYMAVENRGIFVTS